MWGTGWSAASTPLASEMMTGIVWRSLQKRPICWKTGRVSVEGRTLTTISASQTASCRLVTTLRGQRGVPIMLMQNPSRRISSAFNVRSPNLASTYLRYAHSLIRRLNTSSRALMTSNTDALLLVCPLPSLLVAIFASAEVGFESLRQTIFLTCRMLSERKILSSVRREEGASR